MNLRAMQEIKLIDMFDYVVIILACFKFNSIQGKQYYWSLLLVSKNNCNLTGYINRVPCQLSMKQNWQSNLIHSIELDWKGFEIYK